MEIVFEQFGVDLKILIRNSNLQFDPRHEQRDQLIFRTTGSLV